MPPKRVLLAFDADWRTNSHVAHALGHVAMALVEAGYAVEVEDWEPTLGKGIDDLLAAGHRPVVQSVVSWLPLARLFSETSGRWPSHMVVEVV
jgi:hypothetical protein